MLSSLLLVSFLLVYTKTDKPAVMRRLMHHIPNRRPSVQQQGARQGSQNHGSHPGFDLSGPQLDLSGPGQGAGQQGSSARHGFSAAAAAAAMAAGVPGAYGGESSDPISPPIHTSSPPTPTPLGGDLCRCVWQNSCHRWGAQSLRATAPSISRLS